MFVIVIIRINDFGGERMVLALNVTNNILKYLKSVNTYLADFDNIIGVIGIIVAIIGIVVGGVGVKQIRDVNKIKVSRSEVNNSQVANTINNSGIGVKDTEYLASKVTDEKLKDMFIASEKEPDNQRVGSIWLEEE